MLHVENQAPPLEGLNLFETNVPLVEALEREGGGWARERARAAGAAWGGEPLRWGFEANEHPPRLRDGDVEFHPSWHALLALARDHELHALPWRDPRPGAHVARAALYVTAAQAEAGFGCPITMTFAAVPALRAAAPAKPARPLTGIASDASGAAPELAAEWEPRLTAIEGAYCGMAMTEKQGGSDVRANTTTATPIGGDEYVLHGEKWFCSAPFSDLFLVLAQTDDGLGCFAMPRCEEMRIRRLKDKVGNRSNASAEIVLDGAPARLVGEPGRGVRTIIEMVAHTRLDCALGTSAQMRWAVANATWHAAHRSAFGRLLAEQPLMQNVLADLCLESEAATALAMRLARAYDDDDAAFKRVVTAVAKYWICKRGPRLAFEAMECLGGNGYVEEAPLGRIYREMPVNSIWEGSGNVNALDVLRAMRRSPDALDAVLAECEGVPLGELRRELAADDPEPRARRIVELLALALQGSLLLRHAPAYVSDAFLARHGHEYGTLPRSVDCARIVARHTPSI